MKAFHFIPGTQTPDQFNELIADYCAEHDIVDVDARCIGDTLWVTLVEAEDLPTSPLLLSPFILTFTPADMGGLAKRVDEAALQTAQQGTEEDPLIIVKAIPVVPNDFKSIGYVLMLTCVGVLDDGQGEGA